jgi:anion-transporting  ArsA/GET3 family ATPase
VVDAPATGHGLALLEAPRAFADAAAVGPIARQGRRIAVTLRDRGLTALVAVATPEQAAVDELLVLRAALGGELDALFVNGVAADRFSAADAAALRGAHAREGLAQPTRDVLAAAIDAESRARAQQLQLARLDAPIELPFLAAAQFSPIELEALADRLVAAA